MYPQLFGELLSTAVNASASYMELQMNWVTAVAPHEGHESVSHVVAANCSGSQAQSTEAELARGMDIALGEQMAPQV
jgi:hypothetical protein